MKIITLVLGAYATNCYLVYDETTKDCVVVDPADAVEEILDCLQQNNLQLKAIFLTHCHCDHIGAALPLQERTGVPLWAHKADLGILAKCEASARSLCVQYNGVPKVDCFFTEDDNAQLKVGSLNFRILETPGHTPGGVVIVCGDYAFCGDTIFDHSIGRTDFEGGDYSAICRSIRTKIYTLPTSTQLLPGHGSSTTVAAERAGNPFVRP